MFKDNYSVKHSLKKLFMQRYERYLPTAFDESMSILEKMNKLIEAQNSLVDVVNTHVQHTSDQLERGFDIINVHNEKQLKQFRDELEEQKTLYEEIRDKIHSDLLPDSVKQKLEEWLLNGTIEELINDLIFSDINEKLEMVQNRIESVAVSVKDFGAVGNGSYDDTNAFLEAIDYIKDTGGTIKVPTPESEYIIKKPLDLPSNVSIDGDNANIRLSGTRILFTTSGTVSNRVAVTQNSKIGDHFITVNNTSGFKVGDFIKILSQRPATSEIGEYDQNVGHQTASTDRVYFGEIRKITDVNTETGQLFFRGGLVFQDYLTHNNNETHPRARANATVDKVNYVDNVKISGLNIYGDMGAFARFVMAKNALIENINWYDARDGEMVSFRDCYTCLGRNINVEYNREIPPSNHYSRNALKTVSSVSCGFEYCQVENGTQPVDFSYTAVDGIPNTSSFIKDSVMIGASDDGITTHGISISPQITNNRIIDCNQHGITSRSRDSVITGNLIIGTWGDDISGVNYGIALEQKGSKGAIISNNRIKHFTVAVGWRDGETSRIREINSIVSNNNMSFINKGVQLRRVGGSDFLGRSNVRIQGNVMSDFIGSSGRAVDVYERFFHIWFVDNTIIGNNKISGGFFSRGDSFGFHIDGNQFINTSRPIWFEDSSDPEIVALPTGQKYYFYGMNNYVNGTVNFDRTGGLYRNHYQIDSSLRPREDDAYSLGFSSQRWANIYSANGTIVTSDADAKNDINKVGIGLDFLEKLNPVTYKMKNGERTHYGLLAQEVEKVANDLGIHTDDFAVVTKDENGYGMRYSELIPILIKGIQELNDKIK